MENKINIAIDGYSSCGKSTLAKKIAQHFAYKYIDTGAMYRAVCLYCLRNKIIKEGEINLDLLFKALQNIDILFEYNNIHDCSETLLNGENVENEIRGLVVSEHVSKISKIKAVRDKMIHIQRNIGVLKGVVMDGRDIGSVVFPNAEIKFFITASLEERSRRRSLEMTEVSFEDVMKNLKERDYEDSNRSENPLKIADGAIVIDNTDLSIDDQFQLALSYCKQFINKRP